ncbi:MAG TPA: Os1348 family NHLP clan protein [Chloroflexota bacterium]|nr:Os1348 family NHLP clan protein [Chloroflexota bacterium]
MLERTVTDPSFRTKLFTNPDQALSEYELTTDENSALRDLYVESGQSESSALDKRETKKVLPFWLTGGL